ncbi:hypothetical protein [Streptomyces sp. ERV7]|nr:hypothetical protein [Streptomyces sp. ERV7]
MSPKDRVKAVFDWIDHSVALTHDSYARDKALLRGYGSDSASDSD